MKPNAQQELDEATVNMIVQILHKDELDMTEADRAFLRARVSYIKQKHIDALPGVFTQTDDTKQSKPKGKKADPKQTVSQPTPQVQAPETPPVPFDEDEDEEDDSDSDDDEAEG